MDLINIIQYYYYVKYSSALWEAALTLTSGTGMCCSHYTGIYQHQ